VVPPKADFRQEKPASWVERINSKTFVDGRGGLRQEGRDAGESVAATDRQRETANSGLVRPMYSCCLAVQFSTVITPVAILRTFNGSERLPFSSPGAA